MVSSNSIMTNSVTRFPPSPPIGVGGGAQIGLVGVGAGLGLGLVIGRTSLGSLGTLGLGLGIIGMSRLVLLHAECARLFVAEGSKLMFGCIMFPLVRFRPRLCSLTRNREPVLFLSNGLIILGLIRVLSVLLSVVRVKCEIPN